MTVPGKSKPTFTITPFGENGWIAEFESRENDVAAALFVNAVAKQLRAGGADQISITDAVAGIDSIAIRFDPSTTSAKDARAALADAIAATPLDQSPSAANAIEIPVCYGGEYGPDFDELCAFLGLSPDQLIKTHTARAYRVLTLGFAPGFAYLGPLDQALFAPRLETPRPRVEAGAVGIAGPFTGVYPLDSPGGWRIIGRTPACLFDAKAPSPFVFEPGAEIRFAPINGSEFLLRRQQSS